MEEKDKRHNTYRKTKIKDFAGFTEVIAEVNRKVFKMQEAQQKGVKKNTL